MAKSGTENRTVALSPAVPMSSETVTRTAGMVGVGEFTGYVF